MSNDVEIVVRDKDATGPGFAKARAKAHKTGDDIQDTMGKSGTKAGEKFSKGLGDGIGKGAKQGKESIGTVSEAIEHTDKRIKSLTADVQKLGAEFLQTGDQDVYKKLRDTRGVLSGLKQIRKEIGDIGDKSGDDLEKGIKKKDWKKSFASIGMAGGEGISLGLLKSSPALQGAVGAIGISLGTVLLSAMSGIVVAGGTAGMIGVGAALLREDPRVRGSAEHLMDTAKSVFTEAAEPLAKPLVSSINTIEREMRKLGPSFKDTFASASPHIDTLTKGLTGLVGAVLPGLNKGIANSGPVVRSLSRMMVDLGDATGDAFESMASDAEGAAIAIDGVSNILTYLIRDMGKAAGSSNAAIKDISEEVDIWRERWVSLKGVFGFEEAPLDKLERLGNKMSQDADHARTLGRSMHTATDAMKALNTATMEHNTLALAAADADIGFKQAVADASKAIKDNGKHLSLNTQKGRDNRSALLGIASGAINAAASIKELGGKQSDTARRLNQGYTAFVKAAKGAGMSRTAADSLARSYGLLPKAKSTTIKAPGAKGSKAQVDKLRNSISQLHGKTVRLTIQEVRKTYGASSAIAAQMYRRAGLAHGGITGAQAGGPRSGLTWVGEQGPELIDAQPGTRVHSAQDSARMAATGAGGWLPPLVLEVRSGGTQVDAILAEILRNHINARWGGNVQNALSGRR